MTSRFFRVAAVKWRKLYRSLRHSKVSFRQAMALFFGQHGYWPPETLPLMPTSPLDVYKAIRDVPPEHLHGCEKQEAM